MRLLIFGHYSHTGFGVVTENLASRFLARGWDVRVIAVNHRGEPVRGPLAGRVWPANLYGDAFGGNLSAEAIDGKLWQQLDTNDQWAADVVLVVSDMSGFIGHLGPAKAAWRSVPVFHYCPIEGDNLPPSWAEIWQQFRPVAMSTFGARVIEEHIGSPVPMIYHGVDAEKFYPVSFANPIVWNGRTLRSKDDCKRAFGFDPARKIVLRTDRFVPRKFYHTLFEVMTQVFDADPLVDLIIHCRPQDEGGNLLEEIARLPRAQWEQKRVMLTNAHDTWRGLPIEGLVALMNAADLYVSTTSGEGFGLTLAESLACAVPVVCTDWAAESEVVGPGGILVPPLIDSYGSPVRYHSTYGMDWCVPDARGFVQPILDLLAKPHRRKAIGAAGRAHVTRSFRWDDAADQFIALLSEVPDAAARLAG